MARVDEQEQYALNGTCRTTWLMSSRLNSDIIECDKRLVIKLYSHGVPREFVEEEVRLTRLAHNSGIRTPIIHRIVQDGDRWGYSYEKLNGPTCLDLIARDDTDLESLGRSFALAHQGIHGCREARMPSLKVRLRETIERGGIDGVIVARALGQLTTLPDGDWICHGDFHPDNVIVTDQGETILDWVDATSGHYLADVARSLLLMEVWLPDQFTRIGAAVSSETLTRFHGSYRTHYMLADRAVLEMIHRWLLPVAVARLAQKVPGEEARIRKIIDELLEREVAR